MGDKEISMLPATDGVTDDTLIPVYQPGATEPAQHMNGKQFAEFVVQRVRENMGNGLTDTEKALMLSLFKAAAYTENVSAKVTQLESLWSGSGGDSGGSEGGGDSGSGDTQTYTVTNNLTNVTNSNSATTASGYYSATLSIESGYEFTEITITMGGVDITDSAYGDGGILISNVTGDIVITASAQLIGQYPVYRLATPTTFDGTNTVDTGYTLFDKGDDKDWTLLLDFTSSVRPGRVITSGTTTVFSMASESYYWFVYYGSNKWNKISDASNGVKLAITHVAGSKTLTFYYLDSDVVASESFAGQDTADTKLATTCVLGGIPDGKADGFTGTIDTCEIYERILSADEISDFMGVA